MDVSWCLFRSGFLETFFTQQKNIKIAKLNTQKVTDAETKADLSYSSSSPHLMHA